jgi:Reverse transcriptase (RNA-dependent DNA polymerase)
VYCTFLDASKAFDRVNYTKMLQGLIDRNLPNVVTPFLLRMYTGHETMVSWNKVYSDSFAVLNDVRQRGILGPILFCVYINKLILRLQKLNKGCFIGGMFVGGPVYADNFVLLTPTPNAMRELLNVFHDFSSQFDLTFNSAKSKGLFFSRLKLLRKQISVNLIFS